LNNLRIKHNKKLKSLHFSSIKNQSDNSIHSTNNSIYNQRNAIADNQLIKETLFKFTSLECLSIDYEYLSNELLDYLCSKGLKKYVFFWSLNTII
jgi:hypothetical protein